MSPPAAIDLAPVLLSQLPAWLASRLGPSAIVTGVHKLAGGYSNETWRVDCRVEGAPFAFVLRRSSKDGVASPFDMQLADEFALLKALAPTPIPAPEPLWLERDSALLGEPFLAMACVGGETGPRFFPLDDPARDAKLQSYVDTLASIHQLDWEAHGIGRILAIPTAQSCAQDALRHMIQIVEGRGVGDDPLIRRAIAWLQERLPPQSRVTLVHGDPNISNYRFCGSSVVAVLDWELAKLTDPAWDLAFYCGSLVKFFHSSSLVQARERERFLDLYEERTSQRYDLAFWDVLFMLRAASGSQLAGMRGNQTDAYRQHLKVLTA
ncbi:phosphotransferase family protein [Sphingobium sp. CR2-8]|uniref:phosphotransferase family protein n=1 Tax=Sphingobium sp. CR2-8 TaxID=1306534 RepID=UPI002DB59030|nr:phosphotransferase family protein [Sphingobium sp. CR2-8]MEC3909512.1 phosphotransferase family protein [Sphingobium sp. CR2-8]